MAKLSDWIRQVFARENIESDTYARANAIFLRGLALVYLIAFVSLIPQIAGLLGSHGIQAIAPYLQVIRNATGVARYSELPTFVLAGERGYFSQTHLLARRRTLDAGHHWGGAVARVLWLLDLLFIDRQRRTGLPFVSVGFAFTGNRIRRPTDRAVADPTEIRRGSAGSRTLGAAHLPFPLHA